jgi:hypothetical protein
MLAILIVRHCFAVRLAKMELRFRSSQAIGASADANLEIKGALAKYGFWCSFEI